MRNEIYQQGRDRHYRRLVEAITDYAIYMLDVDGTVISWNAGAERFKGYTAAEILGQNFSRFFTAEDQLAGLPARALATAREQGRFLDEGWRVRKDGSRFWASAVIDPIRDDHGKLTGFAKITRDITESTNWKLPESNFTSRRRWRRSGSSPAAWRMISTICFPPSPAAWN